MWQFKDMWVCLNRNKLWTELCPRGMLQMLPLIKPESSICIVTWNDHTYTHHYHCRRVPMWYRFPLKNDEGPRPQYCEHSVHSLLTALSITCAYAGERIHTLESASLEKVTNASSHRDNLWAVFCCFAHSKKYTQSKIVPCATQIDIR